MVPVEVEWSEVLEEAKANLTQAPRSEDELAKFTTRQGPGFDANEFREEMASLAAVDPAAAVLASFTRLERMLRKKVDVSNSHRPGSRVTTRELGRLASEQGLWSDKELAAFQDLIPLRNLAAHGEDVVNLDESRAYEFAELALQLMIALLLGRGETIPPQG